MHSRTRRYGILVLLLVVLFWANLPREESLGGFIETAGFPLTFATWVDDKPAFSFRNLAIDIAIGIGCLLLVDSLLKRAIPMHGSNQENDIGQS